MTTSPLRSDPLRSVLDRVHAAARGDRWKFLGLAPTLLAGFLRRRPLFETLTPSLMKECYIPVSRECGEFLYLTVRALGARNVVEFGTSFGISTLYLAAGVRDAGAGGGGASDGRGQVIGSEIEPGKHAVALANLKEAGLDAFADVRLGDATETLRELPEPVDLLFLDGWKDLYLPVLELVRPNLRRGSVVIADNIQTFKRSLRPYVEHMQGDRGFVSTTLHLGEGFEYSVSIGEG